ncbi:hypothetical protein EV426DRAFT_713813 [Tirmania nivea]|nr:hypothetical protein EV426DRAFT_713813 [Tirmania nivea]
MGLALSGLIVCIVKLTTDAVAVACCFLRWYILREHTQTTESSLSHILFALAILCEIVATIQSSIVLLDADKVIAEQGIVAAQRYLLNERVLKITFFAHLMYYLAECVLKAAYLAFYADLYARVHTKRGYAVWVATVVWVVSYFSAIVLLFTFCLPFEQNWKPDGKNPHCPVLFNIPVFFVLAGANILSDIAILIVPLLVISAMRLGRTEKVSLALVFSIGMISIAASVIRAGIVGHRFITANHTWDTVWGWMLWSHAEMFFGVLAFTLPSFRYILVRGMTKVVGSSQQKSRNYKLSNARKWTEGESSIELGSAKKSRHDRKVRDGVFVETTVTLREESPDRKSDRKLQTGESQTELTKTAGSTGQDQKLAQRIQGGPGYEWRIDRDSE